MRWKVSTIVGNQSSELSSVSSLLAFMQDAGEIDGQSTNAGDLRILTVPLPREVFRINAGCFVPDPPMHRIQNDVSVL
jgi:hypothetical protein